MEQVKSTFIIRFLSRNSGNRAILESRDLKILIQICRNTSNTGSCLEMTSEKCSENYIIMYARSMDFTLIAFCIMMFSLHFCKLFKTCF